MGWSLGEGGLEGDGSLVGEGEEKLSIVCAIQAPDALAVAAASCNEKAEPPSFVEACVAGGESPRAVDRSSLVPTPPPEPEPGVSRRTMRAWAAASPRTSDQPWTRFGRR